jgi:hypothetical protein
MLVDLRGREVAVRYHMGVVGRKIVDHMLVVGRMAADRRELAGHKEREKESCRSLAEEGSFGVEEDYQSSLVAEDIGFGLGRRRVDGGIVPGYCRSNRCQTY